MLSLLQLIKFVIYEQLVPNGDFISSCFSFLIYYYCSRVFWFVAIIICIGSCANLIKNLWVKWDQTPVIVSFAETTTPVWQVRMHHCLHYNTANMKNENNLGLFIFNI